MNVSDLAPLDSQSNDDKKCQSLQLPVEGAQGLHSLLFSVPTDGSAQSVKCWKWRTWHIPTWVLVIAIATLVVCISAGTGFSVVLVPLQRNLETYLDGFADENVVKVAAAVQRHYRQRFTVMQWLAELSNTIDLLPDPTDPRELVKWAGPLVLALDIRVSYALIQGTGFSLGRFSAVDAMQFPAVPGAVVADRFNASETTVSSQYYTSTGGPAGPLVVHPNISFSIFAQPYGAFFNVTKPFWTKPYVSFQTRSSTIVTGRNFSVWSAARSSKSSGLVGLIAWTQEVISYLRSLKVAETGLVILFDTASTAFVGGNFVEDSTVTEPGPGPASRRTRLATLSDLQHPVASRLVRASVAAGGALTNCLTPCHLFLTESGTLQTRSVLSDRLLLIFENFAIVRVASIVDDHGIDMRLIVLLPTSDFASGVRQGARIALMVSLVVMCVLLCSAAFFVHWALRPLESLGAQMQSLATRHGRAAVTSSETASIGSDVFCRCDAISVREIDTLKRATDRLVCELRVVSSFLSSSAQLICSQSPSNVIKFRDTPDCAALEDHDLFAPENAGVREGVALGVTREVQLCPFAPSTQKTTESDPSLSTVSLLIAPAQKRVPVTCMIVNYNGFQRLAESVPPRQLLTVHTEFLSCVSKAVVSRGGCVAMFYGDHVLCHFNVERRLMKHAAAACSSAIEVLETLSARGLPLPYIGISTGECLCYTPRCAIAVEHVVGACVLQAFALCAYAKEHVGSHSPPLLPLNGNFLVSWKTAQFLGASHRVVHVRVCLLPHESIMKPISTVLQRRVLDCRWKLILPRCTTAACMESAVLSNNLAFSLAADRRLHEALKVLNLSGEWSAQTSWLLQSFLPEFAVAVA